MSDVPDDPFLWVGIRMDADRKVIAEASLVLTAVGIDNVIERVADGWCLYARRGHLEVAQQQLEFYRTENQPQRVRIPPIITFDSGWAGVLGFLVVIWLIPALQSWSITNIDWYGAGRLEAGLLIDGQWWRAFTALTLHADLAHIVANSIFGAIFGVMVGRYLGSGFGWLLVLLSAGFGNTLNAWLRPDEFRSLGASTATFACVGLFAAFVWRRGYFRGRGWRRSFAPVFSAVALLAFTGMGGANTDVLAHVTGFGSGLAAGILVARFDLRRLGYSGQYISGASAILLIAMAWMLAT